MTKMNFEYRVVMAGISLLSGELRIFVEQVVISRKKRLMEIELKKALLIKKRVYVHRNTQMK